MSQLLVDLKNGVNVSPTFSAKSLAANTNGAGVDMQNGEVRCHAVVSLGALADNATARVTIEESDDNTTFAAAADTTNTNTGTLNTANAVTVLSFARAKRYVRGVFTLVAGGANAAVLIDVELISQKKYAGNNVGYTLSPGS